MRTLACVVLLVFMATIATAGFAVVPSFDQRMDTIYGKIVSVGMWQYAGWHTPPAGLRHVVIAQIVPDGLSFTIYDYEALTDGVRCWYTGMTGLWGMEREYVFPVGHYRITYQVIGEAGEIYSEAILDVEVSNAWDIHQ